jgi:hypothetical protein
MRCLALLLFILGGCSVDGNTNDRHMEMVSLDVLNDESHGVVFFIEKFNVPKKNYKVAIFSPRENLIELSYRFRLGDDMVSSTLSTSETIFSGELHFMDIEMARAVSTERKAGLDLFSNTATPSLFVELITVSIK